MSHRLRRPSAAPQWPSFQGTSQYVGTSVVARVAVYVDATLGAPAVQNAQDLLADADRIVSTNDRLFGTAGSPVNVIIFAMDGRTDGTGGADHNACNYTSGGDIEVCASYGNGARVSALFEAELSECSMGGNLCGQSTGEALSRWCATAVSNDALADFATAPQWAQNGMPDFVNKTDNTDQNAVSTGCGMAFLSWMQSLGFALGKIAPAMVKLGTSSTFADLYGVLAAGPRTQAWPTFLAAAKALPKIVSDDPFGKSATHAKGARSKNTPSKKAPSTKTSPSNTTSTVKGQPAAETAGARKNLHRLRR